jgi:DNA adenine methylase
VSRCSHLFEGVKFERYFEPFLGSGAVFFFLKSDQPFLSDINPDLIETYTAIRDMPDEVVSLLGEHHRNHCKQYYYFIRGDNPSSLAERAAKFIYLNRTCWNGLYRVNLKGEFNVPIGTKKKVILETDDFQEVSELLKKATITPMDFEDAIDQADRNDFVFVDPPYTVCHNNNGFLKYNEDIFSWDDQVRLKDSVARAHDRGARVVVLNAYNESVIELYKEFPRLIRLDRSSVLSGKAANRRRVEELAVLTWSDL